MAGLILMLIGAVCADGARPVTFKQGRLADPREELPELSPARARGADVLPDL
jgi:hypothetical protein